MISSSVQELEGSLRGAVRLENSQVVIEDETTLRNKIDGLVYDAVFAEGLVRDTARWLIWEAAQTLGIYPSSIHEIYMARGRGEIAQMGTVPALNMRAMNFNSSRAVFRAANELGVGAFIFEIARSEIGYTDQRPAEYVASLLGAAIKEGFRGPLFIQGDHFQVSAKGYRSDPDREMGAVQALMAEAIEAGFYNIDIDTSTLVDLTHESLDQQQTVNYKTCAELTRYAREIEPEGVTISLGGEIGEVGGHNSTVEELRAFMRGYLNEIGNVEGISKISVQTGTSHGGVVLPNGTLAQVKVDFDTLRELGRVAREEYGLGGAVQHGASTLPPGAFDRFPEAGTIEIHLATNFQNIIYDLLPQEVVDDAYDHVRENLAHEWKEGQTEDQFIYSSRKKAIGPFKKAWWDLDRGVQEKIGRALQEQFEFLFQKLSAQDTKGLATRYTTIVKRQRPRPQQEAEEAELEIAADLAD